MMPIDPVHLGRLPAAVKWARFLFLLLVLGLIPVSSPAKQEKTYGNIHHARFIDAQSAELLIFDIPGLHPLLGDRVRVQVRGMDTPQMVAHCDKEKLLARKAREVVSALLLKARHITLQDVARGRAFVIRATVLADNHDIRDILFKTGLAFPSANNDSCRDWCKTD